MFQIEIEIHSNDGDAFDNVLWCFCADRLPLQPEPVISMYHSDAERFERRKIIFDDAADAISFRRRWSLFEDARIDWTQPACGAREYVSRLRYSLNRQ